MLYTACTQSSHVLTMIINLIDNEVGSLTVDHFSRTHQRYVPSAEKAIHLSLQLTAKLCDEVGVSPLKLSHRHDP